MSALLADRRRQRGLAAIALGLLARLRDRAASALPGSTASAKRMLASVYSCPQYTRVSRRQRRERATATPTSAAAFPRTGGRTRPRTACRRRTATARRSTSPKNAMWPAVWPGMSSTAQSHADPGHLDLVAFAERAGAVRESPRARGRTPGTRIAREQRRNAADVIPVVMRGEDRRQAQAVRGRGSRAPAAASPGSTTTALTRLRAKSRCSCPRKRGWG